MQRLFSVFLILLQSKLSISSPETYYFSDKFGLGRYLDGIGGLSAGASSVLLKGYPEQQRNEILDYMFKPNFGASFQILKVEIGGDAQSTDGTESTHMRTPDEENYERGYEWWLMLEAKKRNPNIKLYGLPWGWPGWVGGDRGNVYDNPEQTAMYIVKWITGAKTAHNLTIDYIGIWNERMYNITYIKTLRKSLDSNGLQSTRIIAADYFGWDTLSDEIINDPELAADIYGIGVHYPGTVSSLKALESGKQLWASEDYSTYDDVVGGGCWARLVNQNYVNGFLTSTISWALLASWYEGLPFYGDGLMTAVEPWSGHYDLASPLWLTAHTTQFTKVGWRYLSHGWGVGHLAGGGSYVALVSPDGKDFTIVIETMSHNHSVCIRPALKPYTVVPQDVTFVFNGSFSGIKKFYPWFSQLNFTGESTLFLQQMPIPVIDGQIRFKLGVDQVLTLTTVATGNRGQYPPPPPSKPFPLPYFVNFEDTSVYQAPGVFAQQIGSFEVADAGGTHGHVLRQMTLQKPVAWCPADSIGMGFTILGSPNWKDIYVQADIQAPKNSNVSSIFIAARASQEGCQSNTAKGVFLSINPQKKEYLLSSSITVLGILTQGKLENLNKDWNTVSLLTMGNSAVGSLNGEMIFNYTTLPTSVKSGFVAMGTGSLDYADFDNVKIDSARDGLHYMKNMKHNLR
ncbi:galactocerebrosidase-like [Haliotis asinina]|uniref:galactocerebrosidase-like n=1 Tax=Haliotis asinina TaxID=109174 RepID=UPI003531A953